MVCRPAWFGALGVPLRRQDVYDMGGGPVWYARTQQYEVRPTDDPRTA
jgi:hypothetical protein